MQVYVLDWVGEAEEIVSMHRVDYKMRPVVWGRRGFLFSERVKSEVYPFLISYGAIRDESRT